ncbi:MAG: winged helix-turn-helix domain-containing protein [Rubrivivax sp.]
MKTKPVQNPSQHMMKQTYTRFVHLARAVRQLPGTPTLDAVEERVLESLAAAWGQGQKVTVLQAMGMSDDSSPTTVHRRLKSLRKKGFIGLHEDETDNRVKFIEPTPQADEYFARLGQCLQTACKQG